jgi:hypothetical protein
MDEGVIELRMSGREDDMYTVGLRECLVLEG